MLIIIILLLLFLIKLFKISHGEIISGGWLYVHSFLPFYFEHFLEAYV